MAKQRSRKDRREAREQEKKQRRIMIAGALVILVLIAATFAVLRGGDSSTDTAASGPSTAPTVGSLAPDFQLVSNLGEQVNLSDYRGQPVAVNFMHTW
jgi:cytochrome oxidase Cu insertion factor (SCO1/SenC/PrrC family)